MTPRQILIIVSAGIIIFNILTVKFRKRALSAHEHLLRELEKNKGQLTIEHISKELDMHKHDAMVMVKKFMSQGKMDTQKKEGEEVYFFKT